MTTGRAQADDRQISASTVRLRTNIDVRENGACVLILSGAKEGSRTPTGVTPQDPESCASTNSATFASGSMLVVLRILYVTWGRKVVKIKIDRGLGSV
jgi:hypothetical protein